MRIYLTSDLNDEVVAVDDDGQVRFTVLPGSVEKNRTSSAEPWPDRP